MPMRKPSAHRVSAEDALEHAALRYLARRDRTEFQIRAFLSRKGASSTHIRVLLARFRSHGYLNDVDYAFRWAQARLARRPMGRERLEAELRGQGIDRATTTRVADVLYAGISERDLARTLIEGSGAGTPTLLRRHGFSEETIDALFGSAE